MNFQDAIKSFSAASADLSALSAIDDGIKHVELFSGLVRRFGIDQRKANLKLDEMTDILEQLREQKRLADLLQERLDAMAGDQDHLLKGIMAVTDQLEDLYRYYEQKPDDPLYNQISLMWQNIHAVLRALGLILIDSASVPYDPRLHRVEQMSRDSTRPPGQVLRVLRSGYADKSGVLRKAKIVVNEDRSPDGKDIGYADK